MLLWANKWKGGGVWLKAYVEVYVKDRQYQGNFTDDQTFTTDTVIRVIEQIMWNIIWCFMSYVSIFCSKNERFLVWFKYSNNCTTIQAMSDVYVYENL